MSNKPTLWEVTQIMGLHKVSRKVCSVGALYFVNSERAELVANILNLEIIEKSIKEKLI